MLDSIKELFATAPGIAWTIVAVLLAAVVIAATWEQVKWWWMNTWMSFPVIGKIARLSKDINVDSRDATWFKSEKTLCGEYKKFVRVIDEHDYNEKSAYLTYAGDNGRHPMPGWLWPVIIAMVFVEAMGFSYVLAGFTIPGASENMQQAGAYGIAFLISALLIFLTHFSGHELFRNSVINSARTDWNEAGRHGGIKSMTVSLNMPQSTDAGEPEYVRRINRIGKSVASYGVTIGTAVFIAFIAIGATYVRGQVLEKMLNEEVTGKTAQVQAASSAPADGLDMSADVQLPAADQSQDAAAQNKAAEDSTSTERKGGWGTFIVLAVIFVALQALGIFFGLKWSFAGQNSSEAYKAMGGGKFATYEDLLHHYNHLADTAQSKLEDLQQRLMERNAAIGTKGVHAGKNSFLDYLRDQRKSKASDRDDQRDHARREDIARSTSSPAPVIKPPAVVPVAAAEDKPLDLATAMQQINAIASKDDKKAYIGTLPDSLRGEVVAELKAVKEREEAKAKADQLNTELDNLL